MVTLADITSATLRIAGTATITPLNSIDPVRLTSALAAEALAAPPPYELFVKTESAQPIGSFKLRGAYNMVAQLPEEVARRGVITYSSGNHAQGVAFAARARAVKAVIVMPDNAPQIKIEATRALGAEIVFVGPASSARRERAEALAAEYGYTIIPPYDHPHILAGQGTCGLEILDQLPGVDLVLAPVSGGGLLSGIATAVKLSRPHLQPSPATGAAPHEVKVFGAEPELAADAHESFYSKTLVEWPAAQTSRTLGDGLRTQSLGQLNFEHILTYVDGIVTVSEDEILAAMRVLLRATDLIPEPSGAVTLAAALFHPNLLPPAQKVVVVLSGGNIEPALLTRLQKEIAQPLTVSL